MTNELTCYSNRTDDIPFRIAMAVELEQVYAWELNLEPDRKYHFGIEWDFHWYTPGPAKVKHRLSDYEYVQLVFKKYLPRLLKALE